MFAACVNSYLIFHAFLYFFRIQMKLFQNKILTMNAKQKQRYTSALQC